jgi:maltooligosyltrehalose synthase
MSARIPLATYRLQFNAGFTLEQATALIDYLHNFGISDCYARRLWRWRVPEVTTVTTSPTIA